ncbi:MAG: hypothetical protein GY715_19665 [Planctomycetes bacterium]|nr:hypothetical protein [Planctomycetota bacterium]
MRGRRVAVLLLVLALVGCDTAPSMNAEAVRGYYDYEFTLAREALRGDAMVGRDRNMLLDTVRLGMAALADGDLAEAELMFGRAFDLLSTAGLNADRTTAAILDHEGVRVWKGDPFEQALTYYYVATAHAVLGDWENARAAAANALFRLTDFGGDVAGGRVRGRAPGAPPGRDYAAVDTDFALGFVMQAIASDHAGAAGRDAQLRAATSIRKDLAGLADVIRNRDYDTLLFVDHGKGPVKLSFGRDREVSEFWPYEGYAGPLIASADGYDVARVHAICDVNQMAHDYRWRNLEDVRKLKSGLGTGLFVAGAMVASNSDDSGTALAGAGMMLAGMLLKSGARADTRHLEFLPQAIYVMPLRLEDRCDLKVRVKGNPNATVVLPDFEPGTTRNPRAVYLRIHGPRAPAPAWLAGDDRRYGNDHTGVRPGDYPWILGGRDVSTPSRAVLEAYQAGGHLRGLTVRDLVNLYRAENILIGSGTERRPGKPRNPSFRHILEGGTGLFTPEPDSMGYKRIMSRAHPRYVPRSNLVRNLAGRTGSRYHGARALARARALAPSQEVHP